MPAETYRDDARALANGVLAWFVRDPRRRAALADSCLAWVADHPDEVGDFDLAWLAARAVATGHEHSDEHPPAGEGWVGELMDASVGVRVAVALHHVGGFGVAETAPEGFASSGLALASARIASAWIASAWIGAPIRARVLARRRAGRRRAGDLRRGRLA